MSQKNKLVAPFLKWVGGKRQLMPSIMNYLPSRISTYYEPFVGGGAVLFSLQSKKAVINDFNEELINVYRVIRDNVDELIEALKEHRNEEEYFYEIRALDRNDVYRELSEVQRASRIIYLNKTCYNGLYRVNNSGQFNSPFGRYRNPNIVNEITLRAVSKYLKTNTVRILNADFEEAVDGIRRGAFVYFDPPYVPISQSSNFTGYVQGGFDETDQIRLRNLCNRLNERGVRFLLSNSSTQLIEELYREYEIIYVKANRAINSNAEKRGEVDEVLIRNYE